MPDPDPFHAMAALQGNIKIHLMRSEMSQDDAHVTAAEIAHLIFTSEAVRPEIRDAYSRIVSGEENGA